MRRVMERVRRAQGPDALQEPAFAFSARVRYRKLDGTEGETYMPAQGFPTREAVQRYIEKEKSRATRPRKLTERQAFLEIVNKNLRATLWRSINSAEGVPMYTENERKILASGNPKRIASMMRRYKARRAVSVKLTVSRET